MLFTRPKRARGLLLLFAGAVTASSSCATDATQHEHDVPDAQNAHDAGPTSSPEASAAPLDKNALAILPSQTDPTKVLPSTATLIPEGSTYADEVPDTLDLAERARFYIQGITSSLMRDAFYGPPGRIEYFGAPQFVYSGGVPNWGKAMQALAAARQMSGYDLDDHDGTLTLQLQSFRNMLDINVDKNFLANAESAWIV